jgi:hypothetical protein
MAVECSNEAYACKSGQASHSEYESEQNAKDDRSIVVLSSGSLSASKLQKRIARFYRPELQIHVSVRWIGHSL